MPASRAPRREPSPSPAHGSRAPGHETRVPEQGVHPADGQALRAHLTERAEPSVPAAPEPPTAPASTEPVQSPAPARTEPMRSAIPAPTGPLHSTAPARAEPVQSPAPTEPVQAPGPPSTEPLSSPAPVPRAGSGPSGAPDFLAGSAPVVAPALPVPAVPSGTAVSGGLPTSRVRGAHGLRTTVPAHPSRVPAVRAMVAEYLTHLRLPAQCVDDAVVAAGELFTNALRHGSPDRGDTITVGIECDPRELRVSVADRSSALPAARTAGGAEESGRGLTIIAALSDDWGIAPADPGTTGKKVWFSMVLQAVP
jgi:anti-sigma regulatory factor (Ser/Thr protein kinase)